jgi:hypothetical protein
MVSVVPCPGFVQVRMKLLPEPPGRSVIWLLEPRAVSALQENGPGVVEDTAMLSLCIRSH